MAAPDLILTHGRIFTANARAPWAEALAITDERIVAVGTSSAIQRMAAHHTRTIDLGERTVVPGLNDAHAHLAIAPANSVELETPGYDPTWQEVAKAIRLAAPKAASGALLAGTVGPKVTANPEVDRDALDRTSPDHPIMLTSFDGHFTILNSLALKMLGIGEDAADPAGGRFERDASGRLTGVAREYASVAVWGRLASTVSDADAAAQLHAQLERAASYGLTTVQDMPVAVSIERTARLLARTPPPVRVRLTRMSVPTAAGPDYRADASTPMRPAPRVEASGVKWLLDGVIFEGSLTSRLSSDSLGVGAHGFVGLPPLFAPPMLDAMLTDSLRREHQLQLHVFGRPAALEALDAMDRTGGARVWAGRRLRFEHGDGLTPDLIARARRLGVVVSQQGSHLDIIDIVPGLGSAFQAQLRVQKAQPLRSLLAAGIPLALGSDGPLNPWLSILGATTHPDRPEEAITLGQAITAYSAGSAYAEFAERQKGILAPGKLADLSVLSQDVFAVSPPELLKTRSILTIVGGQIAYDAHVLHLQ